jgi:hypothetical protein
VDGYNSQISVLKFWLLIVSSALLLKCPQCAALVNLLLLICCELGTVLCAILIRFKGRIASVNKVFLS